MTNGSWVALSTLVGLMAASAAQADFTTIDAEPYASGTDVSNVFDGVTLSRITWNSGAYQSSAVYSASCGSTPSSTCNPVGLATFGWLNPNGTVNRRWTSPGMANVATCLVDPTAPFCSSPAQDILEVSVDTDTDFIQFNATYQTGSPDVLAFDAAGNLVPVTQQVTVLQNYIVNGTFITFGHQVMTVTSAAANIKRLWIAGSGGYVNVDGITFKRPATTCPIEEPSQ